MVTGNAMPPSAPPMYPDITEMKVMSMMAELEREAEHYRRTAKKYKRSRAFVHMASVGLSFLSAALSSATLGTALSGVGIVASPALAAVAAVSGVSSAGLTVVSRQLEGKVEKHEKIYMLMLAKQNSINELVSKALKNSRVSDEEFALISGELAGYHAMKTEVRQNAVKRKAAAQEVAVQTNQTGSDVEKLREELEKTIHKEIQEEFQKKVSRMSFIGKPASREKATE